MWTNFFVGLGETLKLAPSKAKLDKVTSTKMRMQEFETAVNAYNNDTGHLPFSGEEYPDGDQTLSGEKLRQVVRILMGNDYQNKDNDGGNDLGKKYLLMPDAKGGKNGVTYYNNDKTLAAEIKDGWGENYYIRIDYNLDGKLSQWHSSDTDTTIKNKTVILLSKGPDQEKNGDDDIYSWK